jgi:hypothetical protein
VDRCALFVDAGYVLADGGMAVHGTRRRESVSWDYEGLLHLLGSLATECSGLPLLRCYWYEATVEGRRSADHDSLADLPGVKLRLAKMRPGRREGVEGEIHRDLETLARNKAVSDAVVVSADEDLAEVIADVQDLGMRITLLHIAVDDDWTISRTLRQECDDIVEISSEHLRPYVELISGAEPPRADERDGAPLIALRPTANGHGQVARMAAWASLPIEPDAGPQLAGYDDVGAGDGAQGRRELLAAPVETPTPAADVLTMAPDSGTVQPDAIPVRQEAAPGGQETQVRPDVPVRPEVAARHDAPPRPEMPARQDQQTGWHDISAVPRDPQPPKELYAAPVPIPAPVAVPVPFEDQPLDFPAARTRQPADLSGYNPGAAREQPSRDAVTREPFPGEAADGMYPVPVAQGTAQIRRLPTWGPGHPAQPPMAPGPQVAGPQAGGMHAGGRPTSAQPVLSAPTSAQPAIGQLAIGQPEPGQPGAPGAGYPGGHNGSYNGSYSGPQPVVPVGAPANLPAPPGFQSGAPGAQAGPMGVVGPAGISGPVYTPAQGPAPIGGQAGPGGPVALGTPGGPVAYPSAHSSVSLAEAVQSAHDEGQEFGASVARDAPALWLEAVLARKPRMPSDLEARLLQGSALPIDFLLHDEVRHALRRGFWDALERARR